MMKRGIGARQDGKTKHHSEVKQGGKTKHCSEVKRSGKKGTAAK
jgi:hypothetical protein